MIREAGVWWIFYTNSKKDIFGFCTTFWGICHLFIGSNVQNLVTKKELIEGGWIDKYVLGLTTEEENLEVERLANLYPDIQDQINAARHKLCGNFNRKLTIPVFQSTFLSKRRIILGSSLIVIVSLAGFALMCREHFDLQRVYQSQCHKLEAEKAKLAQMSSFKREVAERSKFINSSSTERIKVKGCDATPDAEVLVFKCKHSGRMMLQVVDLPELEDGHHYEVWTQWKDSSHHMIGVIEPPIKYDSMYALSNDLNYTKLQITAVDSVNQSSHPVCMANVEL